MKVLHIITDTNIGGAGKVLCALLENIDRENFDVSVALPYGSELTLLIERTGTRTIPTFYGRDKSFERGAVGELKKIIRRERPDVVHTHASLSGRIAARLCGVPVRIMTRHCVFEQKAGNTKFPKKQLRGCFSDMLTTGYIATALAAKRQLVEEGCGEKKITVIQNGASRPRDVSSGERTALREKLGIPEGAFVVGIFARLEPYKGHRYLIDAMSKMKVNNIYLLIVGDGSERRALEEYAGEKALSDRVIFTGFREDTAPYYAITDVGANASVGVEATSLAIIEAMSLGIPSVVSDSGGNPDTVSDGYDGIVVPQKDGDAIAEAILSLYQDREKLKALGDGARESYEKKYSSLIMTKKTEELYRSFTKRS